MRSYGSDREVLEGLLCGGTYRPRSQWHEAADHAKIRGKVLQAEGTAKTKALGLELAFMGAAGQRLGWLKVVDKEQSGQISDTATYAVILLTQPPLPQHTHAQREKENQI